jgi:uncharacterized protein YpmB
VRSNWQKWAYWGALIIIVAGIFSVYLVATAPRRNAESQAINVAEKTASLTTPQTFFMFQRDETYYTVGGKTKDGQSVFVIINARSGRTHTVSAGAGLSATQAQNRARQISGQQQVEKTVLGWYRGAATWEVTLRSHSGNYQYVLLNYRTGKTV